MDEQDNSTVGKILCLKPGRDWTDDGVHRIMTPLKEKYRLGYDIADCVYKAKICFGSNQYMGVLFTSFGTGAYDGTNSWLPRPEYGICHVTRMAKERGLPIIVLNDIPSRTLFEWLDTCVKREGGVEAIIPGLDKEALDRAVQQYFMSRVRV